MGQTDRGQRTRVMYIENKSQSGDSGPARIGRVVFSKSGQSISYGGKRFHRIKGGGIRGNYYDEETLEEYWISGVKKNREDRHWAGSGPVEVDEDAREEYEREIGLRD